MSGETSALRAKTRRVKDIVLNQFLDLADKKTPLSESEQSLYKDLMLTFARNAIPRTQEITGEDGDPLQVSLVKYADNSITVPVSTSELPATPTKSV